MTGAGVDSPAGPPLNDRVLLDGTAERACSAGGDAPPDARSFLSSVLTDASPTRMVHDGLTGSASDVCSDMHIAGIPCHAFSSNGAAAGSSGDMHTVPTPQARAAPVLMVEPGTRNENVCTGGGGVDRRTRRNIGSSSADGGSNVRADTRFVARPYVKHGTAEEGAGARALAGDGGMQASGTSSCHELVAGSMGVVDEGATKVGGTGTDSGSALPPAALVAAKSSGKVQAASTPAFNVDRLLRSGGYYQCPHCSTYVTRCAWSHLVLYLEDVSGAAAA